MPFIWHIIIYVYMYIYDIISYHITFISPPHMPGNHDLSVSLEHVQFPIPNSQSKNPSLQLARGRCT